MEESSKGDSCLLKEDTYSMLLQRTELEPTDGSYRVPDSVQYEKENKKQKTNKKLRVQRNSNFNWMKLPYFNIKLANTSAYMAITENKR